MGKRKIAPSRKWPGGRSSSNIFAERAVSLETLADDDPEAVARYLADLIGQLEKIARASNHNLLAYLLAMASQQAVDGHCGPEGSYSIH